MSINDIVKIVTLIIVVIVTVYIVYCFTNESSMESVTDVNTVNTVNTDEYTPLHLASINDDVQTIYQCIDSGQDVNTVSKFDISPLHLAVGQNNITVVNVLLSAGANIRQVAHGGISVLHVAVVAGYPDMITRLAEAGADLEANDDYGNTPLFIAFRGRRTSCIIALIKAGADLRTKNIYKYNLLHCATMSGYIDGINFLIGNRQDSETAIIITDSDSQYPILNVNSSAMDGITALHILCMTRNTEYKESNVLFYTRAITALLRRGAKVNAVTISGWTPLMYSAYHGGNMNLTMETLLSCQADVNIQNEAGGTALHYAAMAASLVGCQLLINSGADMTIRDKQGAQPLHYAVCRDYSKLVVNYLLTMGANINDRDKIHRTPIYYTMYSTEHLRSVLPNSHLDIHGYNQELTKVTEYQINSMIQWLVRKGARVDIQDQNGLYPLDFANIEGLTSVSDLLENLVAVDD